MIVTFFDLRLDVVLDSQPATSKQKPVGIFEKSAPEGGPSMIPLSDRNTAGNSPRRARRRRAAGSAGTAGVGLLEPGARPRTTSHGCAPQ